MSFQIISKELLSIFQTEISDVYNLSYRVMNDTRPNPDEDVWALVSAVENEFVRDAFGITYNTYEDTGIFTIQLFSPLGTGTKFILELAEDIRDVFNDRYVRPDGIDIRLEYPNIVVVGRTENYFQVNIVADFIALVEKSK